MKIKFDNFTQLECTAECTHPVTKAVHRIRIKRSEIPENGDKLRYRSLADKIQLGGDFLGYDY